MSNIYWVEFDNGSFLSIYAADAKSMKKGAIRAAYVNARKRAEKKQRRIYPKVRAIKVRCVG